jgi:ATP-dependent RNA helicase RhlE
LKEIVFNSVIIFTRTKHGANKLSTEIKSSTIISDALHGNKSQAARQRTLKGFKLGKINVLVATDIAARGIDVEGISHVINYELPNVPEDYIHRIGRTARAGASGTAISLCSPNEQPFLKNIEKLMGLSIKVFDGQPSTDIDEINKNPHRKSTNRFSKNRKLSPKNLIKKESVKKNTPNKNKRFHKKKKKNIGKYS